MNDQTYINIYDTVSVHSDGRFRITAGSATNQESQEEAIDRHLRVVQRGTVLLAGGGAAAFVALGAAVAVTDRVGGGAAPGLMVGMIVAFLVVLVGCTWREMERGWAAETLAAFDDADVEVQATPWASRLFPALGEAGQCRALAAVADLVTPDVRGRLLAAEDEAERLTLLRELALVVVAEQGAPVA